MFRNQEIVSMQTYIQVPLNLIHSYDTNFKIIMENLLLCVINIKKRYNNAKNILRS